MTTQTAKKAAGQTAKKAAGQTAKKAIGSLGSAGSIATKAARSVNGVTEDAVSRVRQVSDADPRPLAGYAASLIGYGALAGALGLGLRRKGLRMRGFGPMDLLLYGLATEHLSRTITKDSVTAVLRAPFTRFKEAAGEGEANEEVVSSSSVGHALGELLTCPFCTAQWVATGLVAGRVMAPELTTAVVSLSAAARVSDYLNLLYGLLRQAQ